MGELLEATATVGEEVALILAGRCGLRRAEIVDVTPAKGLSRTRARA